MRFIGRFIDYKKLQSGFYSETYGLSILAPCQDSLANFLVI